MFIRGTRVQTPPDQVDAAIANFKRNVVPAARATPGNQGATLLIDRATGVGIGITYWESAKALGESEQMGIKTRTDAAKNVSGTQIVNVERFEIVIMERQVAGKADVFLRNNTLSADPAKVDALSQGQRSHGRRWCGGRDLRGPGVRGDCRGRGHRGNQPLRRQAGGRLMSPLTLLVLKTVAREF